MNAPIRESNPSVSYFEGYQSRSGDKESLHPVESHASLSQQSRNRSRPESQQQVLHQFKAQIQQNNVTAANIMLSASDLLVRGEGKSVEVTDGLTVQQRELREGRKRLEAAGRKGEKQEPKQEAARSCSAVGEGKSNVDRAPGDGNETQLLSPVSAGQNEADQSLDLGSKGVQMSFMEQTGARRGELPQRDTPSRPQQPRRSGTFVNQIRYSDVTKPNVLRSSLPSQSGIQHSKKEDLKPTDKLKMYIVSKDRLDSEQNQDIMEVSKDMQHVIKIHQIHRIKHKRGKSTDSSPQVESVMLSPNVQYRSSARSSRMVNQQPKNQTNSAIGTAPLLSQQDQRATDRRQLRLSQERREESNGSKTANLIISPRVIKPIKIEDLLLDPSFDKEHAKLGLPELRVQVAYNGQDSGEGCVNYELPSESLVPQQFLIVEAVDHHDYLDAVQAQAADARSDLKPIGGLEARPDYAEPHRQGARQRAINSGGNHLATAGSTLHPAIPAASRDNAHSDTNSKKAVLSKNAKGQTSANLSIKGMSGEKIFGRTIDSGQDNNMMLDQSIVEMDKMNSKIQHMEITDMLFETEPKIEDKSANRTPVTDVTPSMTTAGNPALSNIDRNIEEYLYLAESKDGGVKQIIAVTGPRGDAKAKEDLQRKEWETKLKKQWLLQQQRDQIMLQMQEEQSLHKSFGRFRGRKLVSSSASQIQKQKKMIHNGTMRPKSKGGARANGQATKLKEQMAVKKYNQYGLAIQPGQRSEEQDFTSPLFLVGGSAEQVVQEVLQTNNSLVTKVVQRPQTGQTYSKFPQQNGGKSSEKRILSGMLGKPGQRSQVGQQNNQMVIMNASVGNMNRERSSKLDLRLLRAESNKENKIQMQNGNVSPVALDVRAAAGNASSKSALDEILSRRLAQRHQSEVDLMKLREMQLHAHTTQQNTKPRPSRNLTKVSNLTKIVISRVYNESSSKRQYVLNNYRTNQGPPKRTFEHAMPRQNSASTINKRQTDRMTEGKCSAALASRKNTKDSFGRPGALQPFSFVSNGMQEYAFRRTSQQPPAQASRSELGTRNMQYPQGLTHEQVTFKELPTPSQDSIEKMFRNVGDLSRQALAHQSSQKEELVQPVFSAVNTEEDEQRREQPPQHQARPAQDSEARIYEPAAVQMMQRIGGRPLALQQQSHGESESPQNALSDQYAATATFSPHKLLSNNTPGGNFSTCFSKPDPANNLHYVTRDYTTATLHPTDQQLKDAGVSLINSSSHEQLTLQNHQSDNMKLQGENQSAHRLPASQKALRGQRLRPEQNVVRLQSHAAGILVAKMEVEKQMGSQRTQKQGKVGKDDLETLQAVDERGVQAVKVQEGVHAAKRWQEMKSNKHSSLGSQPERLTSTFDKKKIVQLVPEGVVGGQGRQSDQGNQLYQNNAEAKPSKGVHSRSARNLPHGAQQQYKQMPIRQIELTGLGHHYAFTHAQKQQMIMRQLQQSREKNKPQWSVRRTRPYSRPRSPTTLVPPLLAATDPTGQLQFSQLSHGQLLPLNATALTSTNRHRAWLEQPTLQVLSSDPKQCEFRPTDKGGYLNLKLHRPVIADSSKTLLNPIDFAVSDQIADYRSFNQENAIVDGAWGHGPYHPAGRLRSAHPAAHHDASERLLQTKGLHSIQVIPPTSNSRGRAQIEFVVQPISSPAHELQTEHELEQSYGGPGTRKQQAHAKYSTLPLNKQDKSLQCSQTRNLEQADPEGAQVGPGFLQLQPEIGASQEERHVKSSLLKSSKNNSKEPAAHRLQRSAEGLISPAPYGGLRGSEEGQSLQGQEVARQGVRLSSQKRTHSSKHGDAGPAMVEGSRYSVDVAQPAAIGDAMVHATAMVVDLNDQRPNNVVEPADYTEEQLAGRKVARGHAQRLIRAQPSSYHGPEEQVEYLQQNDADFNDASRKSTVIPSRGTPHRWQREPASCRGQLLSAEQLAESAQPEIPAAFGPEGRVSTSRFERQQDASQQSSASEQRKRDRNRAATVQAHQRPTSILDNIILSQGAGIELGHDPALLDPGHRAEAPGLLEGRERVLGSSPEGTDAAGGPAGGVEELNDFDREEDELLAEEATPLNRTSPLQISLDNMQNPSKRRQILSRDKSKRHSTTMLERKQSEALLENRGGSAGADGERTRQLYNNTKNTNPQYFTKTGILTSSSQSQALHSKSDEIVVLGHKLTPNQGIERHDSRSRSLSRSRFASAANNPANARQHGDHYVGSDIQHLQIASPQIIDEAQGEPYFTQIGPEVLGRVQIRQAEGDDGQPSQQLIGSRQISMAKYGPQADLLATTATGTRAQRLVRGEQPSLTSTLRKQRAHNTLGDTGAGRGGFPEEPLTMQISATHATGEQAYVQNGSFGNKHGPKNPIPPQGAPFVLPEPAHAYAASEQEEPDGSITCDFKSLSKERIRNKYDFRFEKAIQPCATRPLVSTVSQSSFPRYGDRPQTMHRQGTVPLQRGPHINQWPPQQAAAGLSTVTPPLLASPGPSATRGISRATYSTTQAGSLSSLQARQASGTASHALAVRPALQAQSLARKPSQTAVALRPRLSRQFPGARRLKPAHPRPATRHPVAAIRKPVGLVERRVRMQNQA